MKVGQAVAEIMKREGIEILCGYPVNHLLEFAAAADGRRPYYAEKLVPGGVECDVQAIRSTALARPALRFAW